MLRTKPLPRSPPGIAAPDPDLLRCSTGFRLHHCWFPVLLCCRRPSYAFVSIRASHGFRGMRSLKKQTGGEVASLCLPKAVAEVHQPSPRHRRACRLHRGIVLGPWQISSRSAQSPMAGAPLPPARTCGTREVLFSLRGLSPHSPTPVSSPPRFIISVPFCVEGAS